MEEDVDAAALSCKAPGPGAPAMMWSLSALFEKLMSGRELAPAETPEPAERQFYHF